MNDNPKWNLETQPQNIESPNQAEQTEKNLGSMLEAMKKWNVSKEKMEHIINYVLKLAEIESKYTDQKEDIKKEVRFFIESSLWNKLYKHLGEYNIWKFDVDGQKGLDTEESKNYSKAIGESITQIILLGWLNKFSTIHYESNSKSWLSNWDKWLADKVDLQSYILGEKGGKNFAEWIIQKTGNISEEELRKMQESQFNPTSQESWGELWILLAKEFWNGLEDVLRFLGNIPSGIVLLPRYTFHRALTSSDNLNIESKTEAEIKLKELIEQNPSLAILELLWEKWIEMIKKLWDMMTSWKQWDIAMMMVTIAGLIAGGAWAIKFGLNMARKSAVKSARLAGREARSAGTTTSREVRSTLKSGVVKTGRVAEVAGRVDDAVSGAGIGHIIWAPSWKPGNVEHGWKTPWKAGTAETWYQLKPKVPDDQSLIEWLFREKVVNYAWWDNLGEMAFWKENPLTQNFQYPSGFKLDGKTYQDIVLPQMLETDRIKTQIMQDVANWTWGWMHNATLKWAEDPSRAVDKILSVYNGNPNWLLDISRWTLYYNTLWEVYNALQKVLHHSEVKKVFIKDNFKSYSTWYRDINLTVQTKTWNVFELQLNTKKLLDAKGDGLVISKDNIEAIRSKMQENPQSNYYWNLVETLYDWREFFTKSDIEINDRLNKFLGSKSTKHTYIDLPRIGERVSGHKLYELSREIWSVFSVRNNPGRLIPEWLNGYTMEQIGTYSSKLDQYSNLLYDSALS